jgi:hypothetical protein
MISSEVGSWAVSEEIPGFASPPHDGFALSDYLYCPGFRRYDAAALGANPPLDGKADTPRHQKDDIQ